MPSYFQFQPYDDRGSTIGQLMMAPAQAKARALRESAAAQARAAEASGNIWGGAAQNIGSIIQHGLQQHQQQKLDAPRREAEALQLQGLKDDAAAQKAEAAREARREAAFMDLMSRPEPPDPKEILTIYGAERGTKIAQGLESFVKLQQGQVQDARTEAGRLALGFKQFSPQLQQQFWPAIRQAATKGGLADEQSLPEQPDPQFIDGVIAWATGNAPAAPNLIQRDPTRDLVHPQTGAVVTPGTPEAPKPPAVGSFEDYVVRKYGQAPTPQQLEQARKDWGEAGRSTTVNLHGIGGLYAATDPEAIADGIASGTMPPDISQYGRAVQGAVATFLQKKHGFNLAQAQTDWKATQKYFSTLNGAQQIRLKQATEFVSHSVSLVQELSDDLTQKLPRSRFPVLNRAALATAKSGALGEAAQASATRLAAQIADMQSELAVMYRGGNASTDEALKKAEEMLKADWSAAQLTAALDLIRRNVQIRLNSINAVGVAGSGGMNPYAPSPPSHNQPPPPAAGRSGTPSYQDYLRRRGRGRGGGG